MASSCPETKLFMVPGPKCSSLQVGNDPSGQRILTSFLEVTVLKVMDDKVSFYDSLRLILDNFKFPWKKICILFLNADEKYVIRINQTVYIPRH